MVFTEVGSIGVAGQSFFIQERERVKRRRVWPGDIFPVILVISVIKTPSASKAAGECHSARQTNGIWPSLSWTIFFSLILFSL